jgi:hypothetical protein
VCFNFGLNLTCDQHKDIDRLNEEFRDELVHIKPHQGWSIEKAGLPRIIETALDAVTDLIGLHRPGVILDGEQQQRLETSIAHTKRALKGERSQP